MGLSRIEGSWPVLRMSYENVKKSPTLHCFKIYHVMKSCAQCRLEKFSPSSGTVFFTDCIIWRMNDYLCLFTLHEPSGVHEEYQFWEMVGWGELTYLGGVEGCIIIHGSHRVCYYQIVWVACLPQWQGISCLPHQFSGLEAVRPHHLGN